MSRFPGLALLVIKSLLGVISQILDQVAALKKQIAAFQERLAELRNQIASLRAQLDQAHRRGHRQAAPFSKDQRQDHPKRPGRKPGQGRFSFRGPPDPGWATEPPVEVGLTEPVCPWCGSRWRRKVSSRPRPPRSHPTRNRPCGSIGSMCIGAGRAASGCAPPIPTWPPISMGPPPIGWVRG